MLKKQSTVHDELLNQVCTWSLIIHKAIDTNWRKKKKKEEKVSVLYNSVCSGILKKVWRSGMGASKHLTIHNVEQFNQQCVNILQYMFLVNTISHIQPHSLFSLPHTWKSPQNSSVKILEIVKELLQSWHHRNRKIHQD